MRLKFYSMLIFCLIFCKALAIENFYDSANVRSGYNDSLKVIVEILHSKKTPSIHLVEYCIPSTQDEANIFFSLDYDEKSSSSFQSLHSIIERLGCDGNDMILKKFILMSQFVDGYFAEDYFITAEIIYSKQLKKFCKIIKAISHHEKERLVAHGFTCDK
jgi:hypothetical protein